MRKYLRAKVDSWKEKRKEEYDNLDDALNGQSFLTLASKMPEFSGEYLTNRISQFEKDHGFKTVDQRIDEYLGKGYPLSLNNIKDKFYYLLGKIV